MTLMIGTGPFASNPSGLVNFERSGPTRVLLWEDHPRRVRVELAGTTVAESGRTKLLHETDLLPVYYFPDSDVDGDLLERSDRTTWCPIKGEASYWSVRVGERLAPDAAWAYREPIAGAPPMEDHVAFSWGEMDGWFEEEEEIFVHPPDPYHRIDARHSSRHVRVRIDGELVAETRRPVMLFETGLPPRCYLSPADLVAGSLVASGTTTRCPYKGEASYSSLRLGDRLHEDLVWSYRQPLPEAAKVRGLIALFNERVDLEVDGELWDRPVTPFA